MIVRLLLLWLLLGLFGLGERVGLTITQIRKWPPTVDVTEAARALGISRASAYAAIQTGDFPVATIRVNRRLRVLTADLLRVLEGGRPAA